MLLNTQHVDAININMDGQKKFKEGLKFTQCNERISHISDWIQMSPSIVFFTIEKCQFF